MKQQILKKYKFLGMHPLMLASLDQALDEFAMEVIGEDEQVEFGGDEYHAPEINGDAIIRNELRAEQRQTKEDV